MTRQTEKGIESDLFPQFLLPSLSSFLCSFRSTFSALTFCFLQINCLSMTIAHSLSLPCLIPLVVVTVNCVWHLRFFSPLFFAVPLPSSLFFDCVSVFSVIHSLTWFRCSVFSNRPNFSSLELLFAFGQKFLSQLNRSRLSHPVYFVMFREVCGILSWILPEVIKSLEVTNLWETEGMSSKDIANALPKQTVKHSLWRNRRKERKHSTKASKQNLCFFPITEATVYLSCKVNWLIFWTKLRL